MKLISWSLNEYNIFLTSTFFIFNYFEINFSIIYFDILNLFYKMFIKSYLILISLYFYFIIHSKGILPEICTYTNEYTGSQYKMFFFPVASEKKLRKTLTIILQ